MSEFTGNCNDPITLDPYMRVCYSRGLVLGVDEFVQEELYFLEQSRWHHRGLHGYGTVCGLNVAVRDTAAGPEVIVGGGMAVDPQGRRIRVPEAQCALLNDWLARHADSIPPVSGSPPLQTLYLVLCYEECNTRRVPIPSGPCRSAEETSAPSRVADYFRLSFRTEPPNQVEADIVRAFGDLLRRLEISDQPGPVLSREQLEDMVRELGLEGSPGGVTPPLAGSPPEPVWRIRPQEAEEYLRGAFRVWVTEVRPHLLPGGRNCASGPPQEGCVLLARLEFPAEEIQGVPRVAGTAADVAVDQEGRPYLLHTQLLQEWLLGRTAAPSTPGVTVHADLDGLTADDHPQYLLVNDATRALIQDLDAGAHRVVNLSPGVNPGDAMPVAQAAGGDLADAYPNPRVVRLQGREVADLAPANHSVLTWMAGQNRWEPRPVPAPPAPENLEGKLVRIVALSWRHGGATRLSFFLDGEPANGIVVAFGLKDFTDGGRVQVRPGSLDADSFQVFAELDPKAELVTWSRVRPLRILPVEVEDPPGGLITKVRSVRDIVSHAAAFHISPELAGRLLESRARLWIVIRGDHVLDAGDPPRAIDGEFLRSALPTGDRPDGAALGIQGGCFHSWVAVTTAEEPSPRARLDINLATAEELDALPDIGPVLAERIVLARSRLPGGFRRIEDLAEVEGLSAAMVRRLRTLITI